MNIVASVLHYLLQVVLDLGRRPEARFAGATGGEYLREEEVSFMPLKQHLFAQAALITRPACVPCCICSTMLLL